VTLAAALPGERFRLDGVTVYASGGAGRPLLLVHTVNAAASAAEVRPLYEHFAATRAVFAVDLPGYGLSERPAREYTPRLMTDTLLRLAQEIGRRCGEQPIDVVGVSLGCEFVARAAVERPAAWRRLVLVSPTGFSGRRPRRGPPGSTREMPWLRAALSAPLWADGLFRTLTRPGVVRYFLERTWGGKNIDETMVAYAVATAREPGARHAPLQFLSGCMFSRDILDVYEGLTQPVWMSHGVRGDFTDYRGQRIVEGHPNWRFTVFQTGALPYFEVPQAFCAELGAFLEG
jgi:pimeloyl-ACP methyl ester carboxylesterase